MFLLVCMCVPRLHTHTHKEIFHHTQPNTYTSIYVKRVAKALFRKVFAAWWGKGDESGISAFHNAWIPSHIQLPFNLICPYLFIFVFSCCWFFVFLFSFVCFLVYMLFIYLLGCLCVDCLFMYLFVYKSVIFICSFINLFFLISLLFDSLIFSFFFLSFFFCPPLHFHLSILYYF